MTSALLKKHSFDRVFDAQAVFRLILDCMANPLRKKSISAYEEKLLGEYTGFLALAMVLLDNEVGFFADDSGSLSDEISSLTLSVRSSAEEADFIFVCKDSELRTAVETAKSGTPADPQKSATLLILDEGEESCELCFYGPGIDGRLRVRVSELVREALFLRDAQMYEYPQGIDMIFLTGEGDIFAIPRLVKTEDR